MGAALLRDMLPSVCVTDRTDVITRILSTMTASIFFRSLSGKLCLNCYHLAFGTSIMSRRNCSFKLGCAAAVVSPLHACLFYSSVDTVLSVVIFSNNCKHSIMNFWAVRRKILKLTEESNSITNEKNKSGFENKHCVNNASWKQKKDQQTKKIAFIERLRLVFPKVRNNY